MSDTMACAQGHAAATCAHGVNNPELAREACVEILPILPALEKTRDEPFQSVFSLFVALRIAF
jgi:hypothetical protein